MNSSNVSSSPLSLNVPSFRQTWCLKERESGKRQKWGRLVAAVVLSGLMIGCAHTGSSSRTPSAVTSENRDEVVRLQLFLDSQRFGPGIVDGRQGEFTQKALVRYNIANQRDPHAKPDLRGIEPYRTYSITADDLTRVGIQSSDLVEVSRQKSQPYTSLSELVAERFHTSRAFVAKLNPGVNVDALQAGESITVPNVARPFYVTDIPAGKTAYNAALSNRSLVVDTSTKMLELRENGILIAAFPITPGSTEHPAPLGEWKIVGITPFPWYRYDEGVLKRGERTDDFLNLPPGPNSPVGILWMGLNRPGIGIHGTPYPETIGRSGSHGCIRLSNWDAAAIRALVTAGNPVTIQ